MSDLEGASLGDLELIRAKLKKILKLIRFMVKRIFQKDIAID